MNHETLHIYLLHTLQPAKQTLAGYEHLGFASVDCLFSPRTRLWAGGSSPQSGKVTFGGGKDMLRKGFRHSECVTPVQSATSHTSASHTCRMNAMYLHLVWTSSNTTMHRPGRMWQLTHSVSELIKISSVVPAIGRYLQPHHCDYSIFNDSRHVQ